MSYTDSPKRTSIYDNLLETEKKTKASKATIPIIVSILLIIIAIIVVVIIIDNNIDGSSTQDMPLSKEEWQQRLLSIPTTTEPREYTAMLAREAHVAGTKENFDTGYDVKELFESFGIKTFTQNISGILLSKFVNASLNLVYPDGNVVNIDISEPIIDGDDDTDTPLRMQAYSAYAMTGSVTNDLIYINHGWTRDYELLMNNYSYTMESFEGKIGLARFGGGLGRAQKVKNAEKFGLAGLILFSDPSSNDIKFGYPNGQYRSNVSFERGSIMYSDCPGNPVESRLQEYCNEVEDDALPSIPVIPIGWGNAITLFELMKDGDIITEWQGQLTQFNVTYNVSGLKDDILLNLNVEQDRDYDSTIMNVYGYINGSKYSNEVIMYGAHRDAWVKGACDDVSGTATMLEIARTFGLMVREGWQPYRTIYFGSWDGEESGLIGSTEFGENLYENFTNENVVTYINLDMTVIGKQFRFSGDPLMRTVGYDTAKEVIMPDGDETLFDNFTNTGNDAGMVGAGSDYTVFQYYNGIPTIDIGFSGSAGTYHSSYDTIAWQDVVDNDWTYAQSIAQYGALLGYKLSYYDIIPFDIASLVNNMYLWVNTIPTNFNDSIQTCSTPLNPGFMDALIPSIDTFSNYSAMFEANVNALDINDPEYNDKILQYNLKYKHLLKQFNVAKGNPISFWFKNILYKPNDEGSYFYFPLITQEIQHNCSNETVSNAIKETSQIILNAAQYLDID